MNKILNPKLFDKDVEQLATRDGFGEGLLEAAEKNKNVVALCADVTGSSRAQAFAQKFPDRFFEVGVAEQNLVTVASGLAAAGKIPFAISYAIFSPGRNWEQIRTTICYNNQPVKIIGSHGGLTVGADGATHQALEDLALMRVLPNMVVINPCDSWEAKKATEAVIGLDKPCYIRLAREKSPVITTKETPFRIGQAEVFRDGTDATIIATGLMVYQALLASEELQKSNISVRVINCHTVKPLDQKTILQAAEETGAMVTLEEHQIAGGLGSAVTELVCHHFPIPIKIIGIKDHFGESGKPDELLKKFGLTVEEIVHGVTSVLRMKRR
ncbi:transketolase family protein [Candidatus Daviesbacteria bacterium]|nr:transketolase family protein [Candidatus Daviesbacteria bacterium]